MVCPVCRIPGKNDTKGSLTWQEKSMFFKKDTSTKDVGQQGEEIAVNFLLNRGYTILARNYRQRFGEVDIIAHHDGDIVFIEVKTRSTLQYGSGFEAVDLRKQQQLSRIALDYLVRNDLSEQDARFDVVAVHLQQQGPAKVEIITNAFEDIAF